MRKEGLIDIYILEILDRCTRENRKMTQREILEYLERNYSICVSRKMLGNYLQALRLEGYIKGQRGVYRESVFSRQEMRILMDSIWRNVYLSRKIKLYMIQGLERRFYGTLVSESSFLNKMVVAKDSDNDQLCQSLECLEKGIAQQRKVRFGYFDYDIHGKLNWTRSVVGSPYYVVMLKGQYYLLYLDDWKTDLESCSLEHIRNVEILEKRSVPITKISKYANGFHLNYYLQEHVDMSMGDTCYATVKIRKKNIAVLIDWYGSGYTIFSEDSVFVTVRFVVAEKALCRWAVSHVDSVEIIGPVKVRQCIRKNLDQLELVYSKV